MKSSLDVHYFILENIVAKAYIQEHGNFYIFTKLNFKMTAKLPNPFTA